MDSLTTKTESTLPDVTKLLREDHRKMRGLMDQLQQSLEVISCRHSPEHLKIVKATMKKLVQKLHVHAACEDQVLFPAIGKSHPIQAIEAGHAEVAVVQAALMTGILKYTFPEDCSNITLQKGLDFIQLMKRHFQMEENLIFPLADSLAAEEIQRIHEEMKCIRARERKVYIPETYVEHGFHKFRVFPGDPVQEDKQIIPLLETGTIRVETLEIKAGSALPKHFTSTQLFFLIQGEAIWQGPENAVLLQEGDGLLLDSQIPYTIQAITDSRFLSAVLAL